MSRTPLKQSLPAARAAKKDLRDAETLLLKRNDDASTAHAILQSLLTSPTATKDQVVQAESDLKDAEDARDAQGTVVGDLQDTYDQAKITLETRREYLQNAADARNPLKQLDSFPAACNVSIGTIIAYKLDEFNDMLADVPAGKRYSQFIPPADIDVNDDAIRRRINNKKDQLGVSFRKWMKYENLLATLYGRLRAEGYTIDRVIKE